MCDMVEDEMNGDPTRKSSTDSIIKNQVEVLCRDFGRAWEDGQQPDILEFVDKADEHVRPMALSVLIAMDIKMRVAEGEALDALEYIRRFPDQRHVIVEEFEGIEFEDNPGTTHTDVMTLESPIPDVVGRYEVRRELGLGGFGLVCLAVDTSLDRQVALKFARQDRFNSQQELDDFVAEAKTVAKLNHPGIVKVFDVEHFDSDETGELVFIVQEFIDGPDLKDKIEQGALTENRIADIIGKIAEAIGYAHQKGFIHRDLKPANILLDRQDEPHVTDFGLAVHESSQRQQRGERSGTPRYMSPELVRGETHRLDGRSDIWSLGVILYQMMTGRKPFDGETRGDIYDEIRYREPKPPRQINPSISTELERIALKCLAKRVTDRYTTAFDLADDLKHWANREASVSEKTHVASGEFIPKGLRSFGFDDAETFLPLLPGPRDREGLPDSIRFWKRGIEEQKSYRTFPVGLLYGPSGCGKSSFVKAGLLPRLDSKASRIYIEATALETEYRLTNELRRRFEEIPTGDSLSEILEGIREGLWLPTNRKLVIVIDQFEQWLHNRAQLERSELVEALRQCDGGRVQCLLLVRDDFWLATSRFLRELEIDLQEGQNAALVDLFDTKHAKKVLRMFGQAYDRLPDDPAQITKDQDDFLDRAIDDLQDEDKIICVRLTLFAEMFKGKDWSVASLKKLGGVKGVGVAYLEETFGEKSASPQRRLHAEAARKVLDALLPESGTNIRGKMQPFDKLLKLSGYEDQPDQFRDLTRILDKELRLITPTDPAGIGPGDDSLVSDEQDSTQVYYQLTHDYLVPLLRIWLNRKKKQTRQGRAELLLAERSETWNAHPVRKYYPALWEYANIRWQTDSKSWTEPQRKMMKSAGQFFGIRILAAFVLLIVASWGTWEILGRNRSATIVDKLLNSKTSDAPVVIEEMEGNRRWVNPLLVRKSEDSAIQNDRRKILHVMLAADEFSEEHLEFFKQRILEGNPEEIAAIVEIAGDRISALKDPLWQVFDDDTTLDQQRIRLLSALANIDKGSSRWATIGSEAVDLLIRASDLNIAGWMQLLTPVHQFFRTNLVEAIENETYDLRLLSSVMQVFAETDDNWVPEISSRLTALESTDPLSEFESTELVNDKLMDYINGRLDQIENVAIERKIDQEFAVRSQLFELQRTRDRHARKQANLAASLAVLQHFETASEFLVSRDETLRRAYLLERFEEFGVDSQWLFDRLKQESEPSNRQRLLLALGNYFDEKNPFEVD